MIKKVFIKSVEKIREGEKDGRRWEMFRVKDENGIEYISFNPQDLKAIGREVEREVITEEKFKNGRMYINRTLKPVSQKAKEKNEIIEGQKKILEKLDEILDRLRDGF